MNIFLKFFVMMKCYECCMVIMLFNAKLLLITERYREEDLDESSNYSAPRPDGKWVEYTDTGDMAARWSRKQTRI